MGVPARPAGHAVRSLRAGCRQKHRCPVLRRPATRDGAFGLFGSITPGADLCYSRLKPLWGQTEAELPLLRIDVDQTKRSGSELLYYIQRLHARKDTIARLTAFYRRVLV